MSLKPHKGRWAEAEAAHTPEEAAQRLEWNGPEDPAEWKAILRRFRDGHEERWWAAEVTTLIGYGPEESVRLVVVTTDPATLPANSSWYLTTNLPVPGSSREEESPLAAASVEEVLRLYGLRMWVEQSYKQVKGELGFSDFQVRSDRAIRRHWQLVFCAFSVCWWAYIRRHGDMAITDAVQEMQPVPEEVGEKRRRRGDRKGASSSPLMAGSPAAGAELAGPMGGPMGYAVALLAGVVEGAPTTTTASAA